MHLNTEFPPVGRVSDRRRVSRLLGRQTLFVPVLLLAALVSLLYLNQTSDVATTGYDIIDLQSQQRTLKMQNEQLRFQIAQLKSLDRVDHEATTRLKMGPPRKVVYETAPPVPTPTGTPPAAETQGSRSTVSVVSILETVKAQLSRLIHRP